MSIDMFRTGLTGCDGELFLFFGRDAASKAKRTTEKLAGERSCGGVLVSPLASCTLPRTDQGGRWWSRPWQM